MKFVQYVIFFLLILNLITIESRKNSKSHKKNLKDNLVVRDEKLRDCLTPEGYYKKGSNLI